MTIVKDSETYMPLFTDPIIAKRFQDLLGNSTLDTHIVPLQLKELLEEILDAGILKIVINPEPSDKGNKQSVLAPNGYIYSLQEYIEALSKMQMGLN